MKKELLASIAILAVTSLAACKMSPADKAPGTYESESTRTDSNGTTYKSKTTTDVKYDENGNKKATVESESSKDPKGLFNKTESKSKATYKE